MYIKEVHLEGFKSYAKETVIGAFDSHFNAITGLNGTGKSNILDAMCFVLGVSSLSKVRASRLEDLISKAQMRGVNPVKSAKVSIVFDNSEKEHGHCPIGYEDFNQIVVSRTIKYKKGDTEVQSQYHLNGKLTQKNVITDMFESIRLDVNNANFIIMQGRITKVVNMRPKELLNMIEETVGALAYQHKRELTMKMIQNSEREMNAVQNTMNETILPAYEGQKFAVRTLKEYEIINNVVVKKSEQYAVAEYHTYKSYLAKSERELEALEEAHKADEASKAKEQHDVENLKLRQASLRENARKEIDVKKVKEEMKKMEKLKQSEQRSLEALKKDVEKAHAEVNRLKKEHKIEVDLVADQKEKQKSLLAEVGQINEALRTAEQQVEELERKEQMILSGNILDAHGNAINVQDKILDVQERLRNLEGPNTLNKAELKKQRVVIQKKEQEVREAPTDQDIERELLRAQRTFNSINNKLSDLCIDPKKQSDVENSIQQVRKRLHEIDIGMQSIYGKRPDLRFSYDYPGQNFDPKRIHGSVYELFQVIDLDNHAVPLEVACGSFFNQVVVDNPETSKLLIEKGNLRRRTTFIPMSSLNSRGVPSQRSLDEKLGKGNAQCAIHLIEYKAEYQKVMELVFGTVVICKDSIVAKKCAFELHYKSVTLEGDVYIPGGFMSGGTRKNAGVSLRTSQKLRSLILDNNRLLSDEKMISHTLKEYHQNAHLIRELEVAEKELIAKRELLSLTTRATLEADLNRLRETYNALAHSVFEVDEKIQSLRDEERQLSLQMKSQKEMQERSKREIKAQLKLWREKLKTAKQRKNTKDSQFEDIEMEFKAKDSFLTNLLAEIDEATKLSVEKMETYKSKVEEFAAFCKEHDVAYASLQQKVERFHQLEAEVALIDDKINEKDANIHKLELKILKIQPKIKQARTNYNGWNQKVEALIAENPNLANATSVDPISKSKLDALRKELEDYKKRLQEVQERLNRKAAAALPETERRLKEQEGYSTAMTRSKDALVAIVRVLDERKANLVQCAYNRINEEFDSMMTMLLPHSHAKLVPVNADRLEDGVSIQVQLGGVWKESLAELSGGQRSLVALALTLSLCMYNPVPFYILDEIDSALDLNHTANIGYLIHSKFTNVQFICVSLKDGMYKNANVLFSTRFEDGTSKVSRSEKKSLR